MRRRRGTATPAGILLASVVVLAAAVVTAGCAGGEASEPRGGDERELRGGGSARSLQVAVFTSLERLVPTASVEGGADRIELEAARGEREGAQLVAWAPTGDARIVIVTDALRGPAGSTIAASAVRAYVEQPVRVERGSPAGRSGAYVDALVPAHGRPLELHPDDRLLAWVDVAVPLAATPGSYEGAVQLRRADGDGRPMQDAADLLARIPVRVRVRAAALPHEPTLHSSIGVDASQLVRFERVEAGTRALREAMGRYAAELAEARLSTADLGAIPPGTLPGHHGLPGDGDHLRAAVTRRGVASVRIPFYWDHPFADPIGHDRRAAVAYLRRAAAWARSLGVLDRSHVYAIDEPDESRAGEVRELHELVHEADPALRLLVTRESSARAFQGSVDIWVPNVGRRFRPADVDRERRAGRETWWYPSITTWQPYPTLFIDELRPTPRALGWLAWRHEVRGFLFWSATHWHEVDDPYADPATYRETDAVGNGDGVLLYPGAPVGLPGTPVPSVRLFQVRDGIDDHDLLVLASCHGGPQDRRRLDAAARMLAPSLVRIVARPDDVARMRSTAFDVLDRPRASGRRSDPRCTR